MPLAQHLLELRNRLMKAVGAIVLFSILGMVFAKPIASFVTDPTLSAIGCTGGFAELLGEEKKACANLVVSGLLGPFSLTLKIGLLTGVFLAAPVWLYQLWAFLAPGLHSQEKKYARSFVAVGAPLFLAGGYLAYLILPKASETLIAFTPIAGANLIDLGDFLDVVVRMVIIFGLAFELPLVLILLNLGGVVEGKQLRSWWRGMVVGIAAFSAIATPDGNPLTMMALAGPLVVLYFVATGFCLWNDRRRVKTNPYADLDDDEASSIDDASGIDHTPEAIEPVETVPAPRGITEDEGRSRRDGYDDFT